RRARGHVYGGRRGHFILAAEEHAAQQAAIQLACMQHGSGGSQLATNEFEGITHCLGTVGFDVHEWRSEVRGQWSDLSGYALSETSPTVTIFVSRVTSLKLNTTRF